MQDRGLDVSDVKLRVTSKHSDVGKSLCSTAVRFIPSSRKVLVDPKIAETTILSSAKSGSDRQDLAFVAMLHELIHAHQTSSGAFDVQDAFWLRFLAEGHATHHSLELAREAGLSPRVISLAAPRPRYPPPRGADISYIRNALIHDFFYIDGSKFISRHAIPLDGFAKAAEMPMSFTKAFGYEHTHQEIDDHIRYGFERVSRSAKTISLNWLDVAAILSPESFRHRELVNQFLYSKLVLDHSSGYSFLVVRFATSAGAKRFLKAQASRRFYASSPQHYRHFVAAYGSSVALMEFRDFAAMMNVFWEAREAVLLQMTSTTQVFE